MPARRKWWDDVVSSDVAKFYAKADKAQKDDGSKGAPRGHKGSFIWGDRVRVIERDGSAVKVSGRGSTYWLHERHLGGEPLLEVYIIDVGQGDGILVVTPEGHNLMIDGGDVRTSQNGGKNAADFVDWKFAKDYVNYEDRKDGEKTAIRLDAMIATHNDRDHFGGLWDLIDQDDKNKAELDAGGVYVEKAYHAGLSWWWNGLHADGGVKRSLGPKKKQHFIKLLGNRQSALAATNKLANPDFDSLHGSWGKFIKALTLTQRNDGGATDITRLTTATGDYLPGFAPGEQSACSMRLLAPIEAEIDGNPALPSFPDGDSKNTNGHSVVLRLDYGDRRIMLTGDLNTHSQHHIMKTFGTSFIEEFRSDVAKGCHHGSHDVSYRFLEGMRPLVTVISSGDTESHDHPKPTIVAASAITGRRLIDHETDHLIAPMVYMTEIARSVAVTKINVMNEFAQPQPAYSRKKPVGAKKRHDTDEEKQHFRLFLSSNPQKYYDWPRLDKAMAVRGIRYGLINIRTDGKRLFTAQMEERGNDWAYHVLTDQQISEAR